MRIDQTETRCPKFKVRIESALRRAVALSALLLVMLAPSTQAQPRPYIGYTYPAGGQQGTTIQVRLGGQGLDGVHGLLVTGDGVKASVVEYHRRLNNQELQLLNEQVKVLKRATSSTASVVSPMMTAGDEMMMAAMTGGKTEKGAESALTGSNLLARIEERTAAFVQTPACDSIASIVLAEFTVAPDAPPGEREVRLVTLRGVSNPLAFHVGQVPEHTREPMRTAIKQTLGKEEQALRKRPAGEEERTIALPCTVNGQIASGEVNRYRFAARKGQHLVLTTLGRQLIPYIADAVPGWFQPVLTLYDADGNEVAYGDDYRFKPDPTIHYQVPRDGEYVFEVRDSIYRGREDFVYRVTAGELPFVTSLFPLGGPVGNPGAVKMKGWNLREAESPSPVREAGAGIQALTANRKGLLSNPMPFALDTLPECFEKESNDDAAHAQKVRLPVVINGRVNRTDDWDVFQFAGKSNEVVVAEVLARRLDSPLDSVVKLADASGVLLAFNDDHEDLCDGLSTHQADSRFSVRLPADGTYFVHLGDTARQGGEEYGYRLRLSAPRPDFELRVVPSSLSLRGKSSANVSVYVKRTDGFAGTIKLALDNPPGGFSASPATLSGTQVVARLTIKCDLIATEAPVSLSVVGRARIGEEEVTHEAVPAEDRMQAFLWRQLVPASDFQVLAYDPSYTPPPKRVARPRPPATRVAADTNTVSLASAAPVTKPKFTKQQIAGRLRQLKLLFEEGLLTDGFYEEKVLECETVQ